MSRVIPVGKIDGFRFGQLLVTVMSEEGYRKDDCMDWLYFVENSDLKQAVDDFLESRKERV